MYHRNIIQQWIKDGEGPMLDFKQSITSAAKISRSIVAFANARGGKIVVGVADHGDIIGVNAGEEEYELDKSARNFCVPPINLLYERYEISGKIILVALVPESNQKPHISIDKKGRKKIYVRIADECVVPNALITEVLQRGDLNNLQRNKNYPILKKNLIEYLKKHQKITVSDYMRFAHCNERSAIRSLLDFMFEGVLRMENDTTFTWG